ncbi:cell division protein FtsQ [Mesonia hippocampi]|uniref:Cell division protein FtsQ n=1 Tax=Mesonia hippocampi TaxID=1628250 RepID=A0A840EH81_9FLAO|nr:cell division protein FtsQ/DivIB [Mesonia hippocampi]MBB4118642.1 cell division protein FtsQ [Mesonia hippocampi]
MKINWNHIKTFALFAVLVFSYGFSAQRNSARKLEKINVIYTNDAQRFITEKTVDNLLIVNPDSLQNQTKESLDLNRLEQSLLSHPMLKGAEVYLEPTGTLGAIITQREPLARVFAEKNYYIDTDGLEMPLSINYSARVPVVAGINKEDIDKIYPLLQRIASDEFLKKHVVAIEKQKNKGYKMKLRRLTADVELGEVEKLDLKINNLKAFYKKALQEEVLENYKSISLKFDNQVVCVKNG